MFILPIQYFLYILLMLMVDKIKIIQQKRDELIDRKMDDDWNMLREEAEKEVNKLRKQLKYFHLDLDNLYFD
jgi:hypothetical protein